ncbi:MAG: hypothetical protein IKB82_02575 [Clostridia bacterium]|nr:hypothetical protein [Clostridia bacterium]
MGDANQRALLREILRLLIREREDAQLLYIPRGEAGMRRMIASLLDLRTPNQNDAQLASLLEKLRDHP